MSMRMPPDMPGLGGQRRGAHLGLGFLIEIAEDAMKIVGVSGLVLILFIAFPGNPYAPAAQNWVMAYLSNVILHVKPIAIIAAVAAGVVGGVVFIHDHHRGWSIVKGALACGGIAIACQILLSQFNLSQLQNTFQ